MAKESAGGGVPARSPGEPPPAPAATPLSPKPTAFTVDFGDNKTFDMAKFEQLIEKSRARHRRVQSASASAGWHRPSPSPSSSPAPAPRRPPSSAKLPRKAPGYHSEGYFSSDQEDFGDGKRKTRPGSSPSDGCDCKKKGPPVKGARGGGGGIGSPAPRRALVLPLRPSPAGTPVLARNAPPRKSPGDVSLLADTSSPELELVTPDGEGGRKSPSSTISEAGTYTIEAGNHTEEQKAKMDIDRIFGVDRLRAPLAEAIENLRGKDAKVNSGNESFDSGIRRELLLAKDVPDPARKRSKENNVLEVTYRYESPTEPSPPVEVSIPAPSARERPESYLERIKTRVKSVGERAFRRKPKEEPDADYGSFTSVTASGVLSFGRKTPSVEEAARSKTSDERPELVVQNVTSENIPPRGKEELSGEPDGELVGKMSQISLNRCRGDKAWIREWANQVKRYNREVGEVSVPDLAPVGLPPVSPRHALLTKGVPGRTSPICGSPSKIPSPVGTLTRHRVNIPDILSSTPDTQSYLLNTQNAITNLQVKLQNAKSSPTHADLDYVQNAHQDYPPSRLPVSQLNRSNSLNYRLHRKCNSLENSPLRNPSRYLITGNCTMPASARILLANLIASKSLETEHGIARNQYSPLHTKYYTKPEGRISLNSLKISSNDLRSPDDYNDSYEFNTAQMTQSLNIDYKNRNRDNSNEFESLKTQGRRGIDQTGGLYHSNSSVNAIRAHHQRVATDFTNVRQAGKKIHNQNLARVENSESPIRRSSSFNVVNKNNKKLTSSPRLNAIRNSDRFRKPSPGRNNTPECDYMSEDSDNLSTGGFYSDFDRKSSRKQSDILLGTRYNRAFELRRARLESPEKFQQHAPANSPRCPGTPEMKRKFGPQSDNKIIKSQVTRDSRSVSRQPEVKYDNRLNKSSANSNSNRMTKSCSAATSKQNDKNSKKVAPVKEAELANWKKRATYDPMKAALEGRKRSLNQPPVMSSSAHKNSDYQSSPVHRSRSFNCTSAMLDGDFDKADVDISSDTDDQEERLICTLPADKNSGPIFNIISGRGRESFEYNPTRKSNNPSQNSHVKTSNSYVTKSQINDSSLKKPNIVDRLRGSGKFDSLDLKGRRSINTMDSDTATISTTNGSGGSQRNSSIGSDEKVMQRDIGLSDSPIESDAEPTVNVVMRTKRSSIPSHQRHSGDFSMTSSTTTSTSKDVPNIMNKKPIQPRYLDISKYKSNEPSPAKNFLRRDPSKTYVNVLPSTDHKQQSKKNLAAKLEQEQKTKELEKWKRRASYDPRKAAAEGKMKTSITKSPSASVLRSQSFHGPMLQSKMSMPSQDSGDVMFFSHDMSGDIDF